MAWMASVRTASARAIIASSSLSSPVTICRLKVLISANSACICLAISWVSCLEFAMEVSSAWMSSLVVRTFASSSAFFLQEVESVHIGRHVSFDI